MIEVGQVYNIKGLEYVVIDTFDYNNKKYVLMGIEGKKINYVFYELKENNGFDLTEVKDNALLSIFFDRYNTQK